MKRNRSGMPGGPTGCQAGCHFDTLAGPGVPVVVRAYHLNDCPKHKGDSTE